MHHLLIGALKCEQSGPKCAICTCHDSGHLDNTTRIIPVLFAESRCLTIVSFDYAIWTNNKKVAKAPILIVLAVPSARQTRQPGGAGKWGLNSELPWLSSIVHFARRPRALWGLVGRLGLCKRSKKMGAAFSSKHATP